MASSTLTPPAAPRHLPVPNVSPTAPAAALSLPVLHYANNFWTLNPLH